MLRRRGSRGLTLIEILLALIVMVLGILGILALFPVAIEDAKSSMEETTAALVAESVAHAIKNGLQMARYDEAAGLWRVRVTHDLKGGGAALQYDFTLPKLSSDKNLWIRHPGGTPAGDVNVGDVFYLGHDPAISQTVDMVRETNDPTDPMRQFAFSFDVRKINNLEYLLREFNPAAPVNPVTGQPYQLSELEGLCKLYEFRIHVFRGGDTDSGSGGGTATGGSGGGVKAPSPRNLIATVVYLATTP